MAELALALYAEGTTDDVFLPLIIQRTSRMILAQYGQNRVQVVQVEPIKLHERPSAREQCILQATQQATGYRALIVHSDADHPKAENALKHRILPGFHLVQQCTTPICKYLLPIIPIQAIESWMLADFEMLRAEIRTDRSGTELNIPEKAKHVEAISKPKKRLDAALASVNQTLRPRQRIELNALYEPLGKKIRLEQLEQLTSYTRFVHDLTTVLQQLNFIS
ncbi:MAG TPA: hypothetical protein VKR42_11650 [Ktedonobacteraceae bacterium]|nr:hypothetical protein [Ktedonobacteraceae bacterium]